MLDTPLKTEHLRLRARMVPFAGWTMPVQYPEGIRQEHEHTRTRASVFDTCHMSEFRISGPGAVSGLDRLMARSTEDQLQGSCRYNFLMNERGGVLDDLILYRVGEDEFLVVGNAGTRTSDLVWFKESLPGSVKILDETMSTGKIDLQGPLSAEVFKNAGLESDTLPGYFRWKWVTLFGQKALLSRTGYTGELGFEIYIPWARTPEIWTRLLEQPGVLPAGLGARDTLRLEAGLPLYGQDMDANTTPVEAGFEAMVQMDRSFIGREGLLAGPKKFFVGIRLNGRRAARHGMEVYSNEGQPIGQVTSGSFAPSLGYAVAMAYIRDGATRTEGTPVFMNEPNGVLSGQITGLPFYKTGTARMKLP